ncbi:MAG: glycoside hydrolase family 15 protein [Myxococcales bacterium]|nr:glycoside hydrolase family 15 protein [Myxococcales bacterium]
MPRDLPIGNDRFLVNFDTQYVIRDIYYPHVGKENHAGGAPFRFGVHAGGAFAWMGAGPGWSIDMRYEADTTVTHVVCRNDRLQVQLTCTDCVDFHETVLVRKFVVKNLAAEPREIRLFFHHDFRISESEVGDTAAYDPTTKTVTHYKNYRYFLMNVMCDGKPGCSSFAIGQKGQPGKEGTWRDAEDDGELGRNPIAQGAVDSVVAAHVLVPGGGEKTIYYWMCAAKVWEGSWDGAKELNAKVEKRGPEAFIERTRAYWKLWVRKEPLFFDELPEAVVDLYKRSLLVVRTQIDHGGGIIAANDSDITQFARDTYSYVWPRDGALVSHALDLAGYPELSLKFFQFCADVITPGGYLLHKYNPDQSLASSWHPWMGKAGPELPIQEDETALVVWALWRHFQRYRDLELVKPLYGRLVKRAAQFMCGYREPHTGLPAPSYDLWEERRGILTFSVAAVHAGLVAAAEFAHAFGDDDLARKWTAAAIEIRQGMDGYLWRPELGRFARMITVSDEGKIEVDATIDASMYGLFAFGVYPADDPKVAATMKAIKDRLWCKTDVGGIARYENDYYHRVSDDIERVPGNPWFICTMWLAQYEIAKAKTKAELRESVKVLEWVASHTLKSGVLAEQVHPYTNAPLSVSPLTWSHATVVMVVQEYLEKLEAIEQCKSCGQPLHRKYHSYERPEPDLVHGEGLGQGGKEAREGR